MGAGLVQQQQDVQAWVTSEQPGLPHSRLRPRFRRSWLQAEVAAQGNPALLSDS